MHDKFKKSRRVTKSDDRVRRQIAREAARRLLAGREIPDAGDSETAWIEALSKERIYAAKRKSAAVLGHHLRPGDLPSDSEVRAELIDWIRSKSPLPDLDDPPEPEPEPCDDLGRMADHLDRFAIYRMRLAPLENVKQNPRTHPEGDALYHSLQVFELARDARPYDEEFLLAALLHDVGKAIDPRDHVSAAVETLRGAVPERTLWLIAHHLDETEQPRRRVRSEGVDPRDVEDLKLLRHVNESGRVPGMPVCSVEEAVEYLRGLEREYDREA